MRRSIPILGLLALATLAAAQGASGALPLSPFGQAKNGDWAVYVETVATAGVGTETRTVSVRVAKTDETVLELAIKREGKPPARATLRRDTTDAAAVLAVLEPRGAAVSAISNVASATRAGFQGAWVFGKGRAGARDAVAVEAFVAPAVRTGSVVVARFVGLVDGANVVTELRLAGHGSRESVEWGRSIADVEKEKHAPAPAMPALSDEEKIERLLGEIESLVAAKDHDVDALLVKFSELNELMQSGHGPGAGLPKEKYEQFGKRLERFRAVRAELKLEVYRRTADAELAALERAVGSGDPVAISERRTRVLETVEKLQQEEGDVFHKLGDALRARALDLERPKK
jgi:hypothetical protein